jgi:hypothetical protein
MKIDDIIQGVSEILNLIPKGLCDRGLDEMKRRLEWLQTDCYYKAPEQYDEQIHKLDRIIDVYMRFYIDMGEALDEWQEGVLTIYSRLHNGTSQEITDCF